MNLTCATCGGFSIRATEWQCPDGVAAFAILISGDFAGCSAPVTAAFALPTEDSASEQRSSHPMPQVVVAKSSSGTNAATVSFANILEVYARTSSLGC